MASFQKTFRKSGSRKYFIFSSSCVTRFVKLDYYVFLVFGKSQGPEKRLSPRTGIFKLYLDIFFNISLSSSLLLNLACTSTFRCSQILKFSYYRYLCHRSKRKLIFLFTLFQIMLNFTLFKGSTLQLAKNSDRRRRYYG